MWKYPVSDQGKNWIILKATQIKSWLKKIDGSLIATSSELLKYESESGGWRLNIRGRKSPARTSIGRDERIYRVSIACFNPQLDDNIEG